MTVGEEYEIFARDLYGAVYVECPKKVVESTTVMQRLLGYKSVEEAYPSEVLEGADLLLDLVLVSMDLNMIDLFIVKITKK